MKKFEITKDFFEIFSNANIAVIIAKNIDNNVKIDSEKLLNKASIIAEKYIDSQIWIDNEIIKYWREAFNKFKTKKGARSSIESLLK